MNGRPVAGIGNGLNEGIAPSEQPIGTYMLGENVRGIDPRTGRMVWGAQRAGLTDYGDAFVGAYPTCFAKAFRQVRGREWYELTNVAETSTVPQVVGEAWQTELEGRVLSVDVGPDGQAYYLLQDGDVQVVNPKGRAVERLRTAARVRYNAVPKVVVAEDGSVFVAHTNTQDDDLPRGYLSRWVRQETDTWTQAWEAQFEAPIATFGYNLGALYVALEPPRDENDVLPPAQLAYLSAPILGPEVLWTRGDVPRPIFGLEVNRRGQAVVSFPSNFDRDQINAGFGTRSVDWVPQEWVNWAINGWAWIDAFSVNESDTGLEDGDTVERVRDRRFEENPFTEIDETSPMRELAKPRGGLWTPPRWNADAFGGLGGIEFDENSALVSGYNTAKDDHAAQLALIPGERLTAASLEWTAVMIVQWAEDQAAVTTGSEVLSQRNGDAPEPDYVLSTGATGDIPAFTDLDTAGASASFVGGGDATTRVSVLSIEHDGSGVRTYLNGNQQTLDNDFAGIQQGGPWAHAAGSSVELPGTYTVLGGGLPNRVNLLRDPSGVALSRGGFVTGSTEWLRDGVRNLPGRQAPSVRLEWTSVANPYIDIDFGAGGVAFDTISWWNSSTFYTAGSVRVSWDNVFPPAANTRTVTPSQGFGDGNATQDVFELDTGSTQWRYLRVELLAATHGWEISELEVFFQGRFNYSSNNVSAKFALGEMVVMTQVNAIDGGLRQLLEGYVANRFGVQALLQGNVTGTGQGTHPFASGPPEGRGSTTQDRGQVEASLRSPYPILAKYGADGEPLAAYTGAGVGLGAAIGDDTIFTIGETDPDPGASPAVPNDGTMLTKFADDGYGFTRTTGLGTGVTTGATGTEEPAIRPTTLALGPCESLFVPYVSAVGATAASSIRRYDSGLTDADWVETSVRRPIAIAPGGAQIDETLRGGACGPEFLYTAYDSEDRARRLDVLGLRDTGQEPGRTPEQLVVLSSGDVVRENATGGWDVLPGPGTAALVGKRPAAATLYGKTFFADGLAYRVYDHETGQIRDFEEAVAGEFPPRCRLIAAYRGRLVVAAGDNAFTIYQSRFGDPFDFDYGPEIQTISQAIAGTTASQGAVPSPITALMPMGDDFLYIGTTDGLFIQTGDLADGGRLDHVDKSHGVAFGYAWCESPRGLYYFSGKGGVMLVYPGVRPKSVTDGKIGRRLEEVDLNANRVELAYNWLDKTVHVFVIPKDLGSSTQHFAYEEPTGAWHVDTFGEGYERAVSAVGVQEGDTPEDRAIFVGFAGGYARRWDQYAVDDAGDPIHSAVTIGPLIPGPQGVETRISGVYGQLATDQAGIEVGVRASQSADAPGPAGLMHALSPGRSFGVGVNACAPAVFIEVRGTGRAWAVHELRAEAGAEGHSRAS